MTTGFSVLLASALLISLLGPRAAWASPPTPVPYRSAPLIPWAKQISEHRFRSPRNYDGTIEYYNKLFYGNTNIRREKIINTSGVRAVHYRNKKTGSRWEGLNVYEYKGSTTIFVVFSDEELERIKKEQREVKEKPKRKTAGKKSK